MKDLQNFEAVCFSNYVRVSPLKIKKILDQIKLRSYYDAVTILTFLPNRSCPLILKALNSAVSNLKVKFGLDSSLVFVKEARVNVGPVLKRFRPRAQGRAFSIKKRMSNIIILF